MTTLKAAEARREAALGPLDRIPVILWTPWRRIVAFITRRSPEAKQ